MRIKIILLGLLITAFGQAQTNQGDYFYAIENLDTGEVVRRGTTGPEGIPAGRLILGPNTNYKEWLYEVDTGLSGSVRFNTPSSGRRFTIPPIELSLSPTTDFDGDGLDGDAEFIIGTDPELIDTDEDGINDGAEISQGLDPLDNKPVRTGIIGS